tara:strand:- start:2304 stop:3041 length:738 start_codon:yes stop_codon:yes gene_type:complete
MKLSDFVKHVSHSSIDLARNDLGLWVARYVYKLYDPANPAMARGNAVELGLQIMHQGGEFDDPLEEALKDFNKRTALGCNGEAREREAANIPLMMDQYQDCWEGDLPRLEDYQKRIEIELPHIDVPCIGFTDFETEDSVIDIKTTGRMPSAISAAHRRQGSIYQKASGNRKIEFIYLTPKKSARYTLEDSEPDFNEVCHTALRLQNFLAAFDSKEALTAAVIPNYDTFYWNNPATREKAKEIFGY